MDRARILALAMLAFGPASLPAQQPARTGFAADRNPPRRAVPQPDRDRLGGVAGARGHGAADEHPGANLERPTASMTDALLLWVRIPILTCSSVRIGILTHKL